MKQQLEGLSVNAIDTPALVLDLDAMERNLKQMVEFSQSHHMRLRPHAKMHKCSALARLLVQAGAVGVCVQKTSEAEVMAAGGINDIYISNEVISPLKLQRVVALAQVLDQRGGRLAIAVDSLAGVVHLAQAARLATARAALIDVFVELDVGHGRCGVNSPEMTLELATAITAQPPLRFAGLQAYHGRAQHFRQASERQQAIASAVSKVQAATALLASHGLQVGLVTGAGSGTFALESSSGVYGELQAGSFLFMDADYASNQADPQQPQFEHALFLKTQVMSLSAEHAVCDAGHKSHAIDSGLPRVQQDPGDAPLEFFNGGDEHGILRGTQLPALGDTLWLIPGHCDPTVNLHDSLIGVRGGLQHGVVETVYDIDARGALL